ncbi:hypothetical protein BaRGS_00022171 [Batillaria attramentaria]|uniref:Uncharacterized protein n=1 Tax=Batillaria attramentaria TaxID=370345 RepID=A0ABD0KHT6_9CAEN
MMELKAKKMAAYYAYLYGSPAGLQYQLIDCFPQLPPAASFTNGRVCQLSQSVTASTTSETVCQMFVFCPVVETRLVLIHETDSLGSVANRVSLTLRALSEWGDVMT